MTTIDTTKPVLVTGATGFVAGWIVKGLLEAGCTVHAAVRNPDNADKVKHLTDIAQSSPGELVLFAADLLKDGSYDDAMAGCGVVFHTASPFTIDVKDPQKELIDPDANGRNIVSGHETDLFSMSQELKHAYGQYPLPNSVVPKWMAWILAPFLGGGMTRTLVSRNFNIPWRADNTKAKRELGVTYRPLRESMEDMFKQMLDAGMLPRKS